MCSNNFLTKIIIYVFPSWLQTRKLPELLLTFIEVCTPADDRSNQGPTWFFWSGFCEINSGTEKKHLRCWWSLPNAKLCYDHMIFIMFYRKS